MNAFLGKDPCHVTSLSNHAADILSWWRHQMKTFSALLALCAGKSPVTGEFPAQRPVTRSFDVFFDLRPNERLSKQWWGWWFETQSCPLWRHRNAGDMPILWHDCNVPRLSSWSCNILWHGYAMPLLSSGMTVLWHDWPVTRLPCNQQDMAAL